MPTVKTTSSGFILNTDSNVVINTNEKELQIYRSQIKQNEEMQSVKDELATLKNMLLDIRNRNNG